MVGKRIEQRAKELKISIRELAKQSGVPLPTIYGYIYGKARPLCETMQKISRVLGKSIDWFLEPDLNDPALVAMFEKAGNLTDEDKQSVVDFMAMVEKKRMEKKSGGKKNVPADKKP